MSSTIWRPRIGAGVRPTYRMIAEALERDVTDGVVRPGERLPTVRALAQTLRVAPLTVSRAYAEAERRGLVNAAVGRGTFVRSDPPATDPAAAERGLLDLSKNVLAGADALDLEPRATRDLRALLRDADYDPTAGSPRHRMAGAAWLQRSGVEVPPESVVLTPGAQQGIVAALAAVCRPGDSVAAEALTYPRFASVAALLHLNVVPVELDQHGMSVHALEKALRTARAIYCVPNFQNPTGTLMPEERRREIAALAGKRKVVLIEDDVYGFLLERVPPPIASYAPEQTCFITSASKSLTPSLRIGLCAIPPALLDRFIEACGSMTAFTSSVSAEVFTLLVESGAADRCVEAKRELIARNRAAANRVLPVPVKSHARSPHLWIELPRGTNARDFADRARARGVAVAPSTSFLSAESHAPNAVRISLGATTDTAALQTALRTVAALIEQPRMLPGIVV